MKAILSPNVAMIGAGVAPLTMDEAGLIHGASIGGQKFSYQTR